VDFFATASRSLSEEFLSSAVFAAIEVVTEKVDATETTRIAIRNCARGLSDVGFDLVKPEKGTGRVPFYVSQTGLGRDSSGAIILG
jgi:hypothetical protein